MYDIICYLLSYTSLCIYQECVSSSDGLKTFLKYLCKDILKQLQARAQYSPRGHNNSIVVVIVHRTVHADGV